LRDYSVAMRHTLRRYYGAGDLHFITCSCYRRQKLLGTPRLRDLELVSQMLFRAASASLRG
jgi:REP element-mobilizing transposase RayT